jgi:hypothetical protein
MDWSSVLTYVVVGFVPVGLAALIMIARIGVNLARQSQNATVRAIGEFAYREIEANYEGTAGALKLQNALAAARQRIGNNPWLAKVDDQTLVDAIQKAWHQNEGQYKEPDPVTPAPVPDPQPVAPAPDPTPVQNPQPEQDTQPETPVETPKS